MADPISNSTEKENRRIVRTFAWASFLNDVGSDIIYPIWPLFVTEILKANMAALGFIDGLGEAIVSIAKAVSGFWSDKIRRRKRFIWVGYLMGAASRVGYALSTIWQHLIPFRILDRAGKIRGAPRDAVVADISTDQNRAKHFGILRTADYAGALVGIILCLLLFPVLGYYRLFMLAAVPSLLGALLVILQFKERRPADSRIFKGLKLKDLSGSFLLFLILSALFSLGNFTYSFLMIYAKQIGFKVTFIPVLYLIFTLAATLTSYFFGQLADRIGRRAVLLLSFLFWASICLMVILTHARPFLWLIFITYGLHKGALEPVQGALVAELAPTDYRASCIGTYQMVIGLSALPASLIAGLLWDQIGLNAPFYFSLGLTLIASLMLFFIKENQRSAAPNDFNNTLRINPT